MSKNTRFKASSLYRRCLWLEYATLRWNVAGAAIVLIVALGTGSPAFADFRLDSAIEIFAFVIVVLQLKDIEQCREDRALKLIGTAFIV